MNKIAIISSSSPHPSLELKCQQDSLKDVEHKNLCKNNDNSRYTFFPSTSTSFSSVKASSTMRRWLCSLNHRVECVKMPPPGCWHNQSAFTELFRFLCLQITAWVVLNCWHGTKQYEVSGSVVHAWKMTKDGFLVENCFWSYENSFIP